MSGIDAAARPTAKLTAFNDAFVKDIDAIGADRAALPEQGRDARSKGGWS